MPHCTLTLADEVLDGTVEGPLILALTDAIVSVYGDWARPLVVVGLVGIPTARFGVGGRVGVAPGPAVELQSRAGLFEQMPDAAERLVPVLTDAVASVLGDEHRSSIGVTLIGVPDDRSGVGGALLASQPAA
jgi:phenylpyruvate tautomerase PptA (4-oxalocrotonate tautomerase family)